MRRPGRRLALSVIAALTIPLALAPVASAQDRDCTLLTVAEVATALDVAEVDQSGSGTYCSFSTDDATVVLAIQPATDLDAHREQYPDAVDTTVAGNPALVTEEGRSVVVDLSGQVMTANYYGLLPSDEVLPILTGLLELAIPRAPAGPDPEDIARLEALMPATIDGLPLTVQSFGGAMLLGFMDPTEPAVNAFLEALGAQGITPDDILFVGGETDSDEAYGATAVLLSGTDASVLIQPMFQAFASEGEAVSFASDEVGGRTVTLVTTDENVLTVYTFGDVIFAVTAPEAELEAIVASLP